MNCHVADPPTAASGDNPDAVPISEHELGPQFEVARQKGILEVIPSSNSLTAGVILERVMKDRTTFMARYRRKHQSEQEYYTQAKANAGYVEES